MSQNVLVVHGGGPTAVINASLYGVIEEAKRNPEVGKVYGAIGGTGAIFSETFIDLTSFNDEKLKLLLHTPASAIGSSRYPLYEKDYEKMVDIFKKHDIKYVLLNGGNGTMDACGHIYEVCKDQDIKVVGIPKTIDNDIAMTDHSPGYGSAARFIAASTQEVGEDVKSLPIHVCIMEAMGRNAGWITAASALARRKQGDAPHLIYLPERPFSMEHFLEDVKAYVKEGVESGQYTYDRDTGEIVRYHSIRLYEVAIAMVIAGILAGSVCLDIKKRYAMKQSSREVSNSLQAYRADCAFHFSVAGDKMVNKYVRSVPIPRNTSSGSGGRGHSGSSSAGCSTIHTSSSGSSHGGGGRRF